MPEKNLTPRRSALLVWGGWDGHEPRLTTERFANLLEQQGFAVEIHDDLDVYLDRDRLAEHSLIVTASPWVNWTRRIRKTCSQRFVAVSVSEAGTVVPATRSAPIPTTSSWLEANGSRILATSLTTRCRSLRPTTRLFPDSPISRCTQSSTSCISIRAMRYLRPPALTGRMYKNTSRKSGASSCRSHGNADGAKEGFSIRRLVTSTPISTSRKPAN